MIDDITEKIKARSHAAALASEPRSREKTTAEKVLKLKAKYLKLKKSFLTQAQKLSKASPEDRSFLFEMLGLSRDELALALDAWIDAKQTFEIQLHGQISNTIEGEDGVVYDEIWFVNEESKKLMGVQK